MDILIIIFFGILGAIIGSFLNVVILRYNTGKGIGGRSGCFTCGKDLRWYELVPVVSYLIQRGRCIGCKSGISKQYPLVEIGTAVLFALISYRILLPLDDFYPVIQVLNLFVTLVSASVLVIIFVYDYRHKIIPDMLSFLFALLSLMRLTLYYRETLFQFPFVMDLLAGPLVALPFVLIWYFSKGKWMGLGDGKLALGIGWFLALCLAFWIGAVVGVALIAIQKYLSRKRRLTFKSEIPFAPFMILGLLIVYFFPMDLFHINTFLQII